MLLLLLLLVGSTGVAEVLLLPNRSNRSFMAPPPDDVDVLPCDVTGTSALLPVGTSAPILGPSNKFISDGVACELDDGGETLVETDGEADISKSRSSKSSTALLCT